MHRPLKGGLVLVTALAILAAAGCGSDAGRATSTAAHKGQTITIGEIGSLTGFAAGTYGIPTHNGMLLAVDQINASGYLKDSDVKIDLKTQDSGSDVPTAVTVFNKLERENIDLMVVSTLSPINQAVLPKANQTKTVVVANAGVGSKEADYEFRVSDVSTPSQSLAKMLLARGKKRVAIVIDADNAAFVAQAKTIEAALTIGGVPGFVSKSTVAGKDADFASVITNVRKARPDAVILATVDVMGGNILRQMKQLGGLENVLKTGVVGWGTPAFKSGGEAAVGAVFPSLWAPGADTTSFEKDYTAKFKGVAGPYEALGNEIMWLYAVAIKMAKAADGAVTAETVRKQLPAASTSSELAANAPIVKFSLSAEGIPTYPGSLAEIKSDGSLVAIKD